MEESAKPATDVYFEFLNTVENSWEQTELWVLGWCDCMQIKGVFHIAPFTNWVPDSVKFSGGVEGCAKISCCEHAAA